MKKFKMACAVFLAMIFLVPMSSHALLNGSFELGAANWNTGGNTFFSPFPVPGMPSDGTRFVQLNNGFPGGSDQIGICLGIV